MRRSVAPVPERVGAVKRSFEPAKPLAKRRTTSPPAVEPPMLYGELLLSTKCVPFFLTPVGPSPGPWLNLNT